MTLLECYNLIGGDYNQIINALGSERIVKKFLLKLIDEDSHKLLKDALNKGDIKESFRAAHTIKGICLNLALNRLYGYINPLTEALRYEDKVDMAEVMRLYQIFNEEYNFVINTIISYKEEACDRLS